MIHFEIILNSSVRRCRISAHQHILYVMQTTVLREIFTFFIGTIPFMVWSQTVVLNMMVLNADIVRCVWTLAHTDMLNFSQIP